MFGLHDTNWDQSARWASGASCGGLIISLDYQAGAGCQMGWANHGVKVPKGNKVPGSETKYVEIKPCTYVQVRRWCIRQTNYQVHKQLAKLSQPPNRSNSDLTYLKRLYKTQQGLSPYYYGHA